MTIKEIAKLAGVSPATVSRVINQDPTVAEERIKSVQEAIRQTGYVPNFTGRMLRTAQSRKVLVLLPTISNQFYSSIVAGIEEKAAMHNYKALLAITNQNLDTEQRYLEMLATKQVDGAVIFFSAMPLADLEELSRRFPIVMACECEMDSDLSYVMINNEKAAYNAVSYFAQKGHKRIAMLSGDFYYNSESARERGYRNALKDNGLPFDERYLVKGDYNFTSGQALTQRLMAMDEPPTAFFTVSDSVAAGVVKALLAQGANIGNQVEIIGFDNLEISQVYTPSFSTVAQPRHEIGGAAMDLLLERIEDNESLNKGIILPHRIVHRESTRQGLAEQDC